MKYIDLLNRFWEANRTDRFTTSEQELYDYLHFDIDVADKRYQVDIPKESYLLLANAISLTDTEEFVTGMLDLQKTAYGRCHYYGRVEGREEVAHPHRAGAATKTRTSANGRVAEPVWKWRGTDHKGAVGDNKPTCRALLVKPFLT